MQPDQPSRPAIPPASPRLYAACPVVERVEPWKGGARAAYSLIHEDLVDSSSGTLQVAVPALRTRGIRAGLATSVSLCSENGWTVLRNLAMEGFEIVNHGWWHIEPTLETASQEIEEARKELQKKVGSTISFYACPDPVPTPEIARYALEHGHQGVRSAQEPGAIVLPRCVDPSQVPYDAFGSASAHGARNSQLETFLDSTIDQGGWGVRCLRGVADTSWDPVPENLYVAHLDRLEKLVRTKELWVAPPTEILRHALAFQIAGIPRIQGSLLWFPDADPSTRLRAYLSVLIRCTGERPARLVGEQNGAPVLANELEPGLWRLQVNPWDPLVLEALPS